MKNFIPPFVALVICIAVIWKWTYGFSAFTVFSYTLRDAGTTPRTFPDIQLINQDSIVFHIKDKKKYTLVNFVYLNCPNVCHKVNNRLEEIYNKIDSNIVPSKLELVTVSFDLKNDNIKKIKNYRNHFSSNIQGWSFALPYQISQKDFDTYFKQVGIWAKAAPKSNVINHSIYLFLISPENKVIKVFDPAREDNATIINEVYTCLKS